MSFMNYDHQENNHHSDICSIRKEKLEKLQSRGFHAWPQARAVTATTIQICAVFEKNSESKEYCLAGRIMTIREHGKSLFAHIQDAAGRIQVYIKQDAVGVEKFSDFIELYDIGDIVWFAGTSFRTKMGEISLAVTDFQLLSKCLRSLPDKFHGLADVEVCQRQRYLDLIVSPETKNRFLIRSHIIQEVRAVLLEHEFVEVETPMLHTIPGGAAAKPFVTHHNALDMELFLRIAPELYLKQLVVGGMERVFEINRCFRNEGISTRHNPEFTSVEYYIAHHDYHFMMNLTEEIFKKVAHKVGKSGDFIYGNYTLNFQKPFTRITMQDAVKHALGSTHSLSDDDLIKACNERKIVIPQDKSSWGYRLYALFEELVEPHLIQPTFITHFPIEVSPLAKKNFEDARLTDRFELFIAHMELSNGFSELNDPFDQAERFAHQAHQRSSGDDEAHYYDDAFIRALEYGLPPTVGAGFGIDRLAMLLTNSHSIRDVILFPTHKRKHY